MAVVPVNEILVQLFSPMGENHPILPMLFHVNGVEPTVIWLAVAVVIVSVVTAGPPIITEPPT